MGHWQKGTKNFFVVEQSNYSAIISPSLGDLSFV